MGKISRDTLLRHLRGNDRNILRPPRHDPDVADVALVSASSIGELDQRNLNRLFLGTTLGWRGYVSRITRQRFRLGYWAVGYLLFYFEGRSIDADARLDTALVEQESKLLDGRRDAGPAASTTRSSGRPRRARRRKLIPKKLQRLFAGMAHGDPHHDLPSGSRLGMWPVHSLGADNLDQAVAEVLPVSLAKQTARARQQRFPGAARFAESIEADDRQLRGATKAVEICRRHFVGIRGRAPCDSGHSHLLRAFLLHVHVAKVADDVGKNVGRRIT